MSQSFPLYDELLKRAKSSCFQSTELNRICSTITNLDNQLDVNLTQEQIIAHRMNIAALILHHENLENTGFTFRKTPYMTKELEKKSIQVTMTLLPPVLQKIICCYVIVYVTNVDM